MRNRVKNEIEIVRNLLQLGAFLQKTGNRITGAFGLTQQQFVVLNEIVEKNPINQKQLVGALLFEKSNVSKIVKKLHSAELIHIAISMDDARLTVLSATKKGRALWKECLQCLNTWNTTWLEPLNKDEIEILATALDRLKRLISLP